MENILFKDVSHVIQQRQNYWIITGKIGSKDGQTKFVQGRYGYVTVNQK